MVLESLDLSQNILIGEIPQKLMSHISCIFKSLSKQLIFLIPQGGQIWTLQSSSFEGNFGLCGFSLSMKCGTKETTTFEMMQESSLGEGFDWKVVVIKYACELVLDMSSPLEGRTGL